MKFQEYQLGVARTAKHYENEDIRKLYYALGLVGEATEILEAMYEERTREDIVKECGDVTFYAAHLCTVFDLDLGKIRIGDEMSVDAASDVVVAAGRVGETVKKIIRDGRRLNAAQMLDLVGSVFSAVKNVAKEYDYTLDDVMEINQRKLMKRYPTGFNATDAIARKDGEELRE